MTAERLKQIKVLLLDVDGVLTDGSITYSDSGEEIKTFNVRDGLGIRMVQAVGIAVGIVTSRRSAALAHRCKDLGIVDIFDGIKNKAEVLPEVMRRFDVALDQVAFVGDDLVDLSIMASVGAAIAVADAAQAVQQQAHMVTKQPGGRGAVREICESILTAQQQWDQARRLFDGGDHQDR